MSSWTRSDIPSQAARRVVVTGANSGIGWETARGFAEAGAQVTLAVRDLDRGHAAAARIDGDTRVAELDLADLASVRAFVEGHGGPVDVLVNNAGIMAVAQGRTVDGFERQIGTNHLGHFALTNLLLSRITDRVVTVSSTAHRPGRIRLDDLNWERGRYLAWPAYSQSKLANLLFTAELYRRLTTVGSPVRATAAHPGWTATNLQSRTGNAIVNALSGVANKVVAMTAEQGALPTLYAAVADLPGNSFVGPDGFQEMRGNPALVGRTKAALDLDVAARLWDLSEELTGTSFPL